MWNLPGPGIEPMSPVLAGGFFTTKPPGRPPEPDSLVHRARWGWEMSGRGAVSEDDINQQQLPLRAVICFSLEVLKDPLANAGDIRDWGASWFFLCLPPRCGRTNLQGS